MSKRIRARVTMQRPVNYQHAGGHGNGIVVDLSLQGCRINGVLPCSCGTRLRLQLSLPDQAQPLHIEQAVVRWVTHDHIGVSFLKLPSGGRERLEHVVQLLDEGQHAVTRVSPPAFEHYAGTRGAEGYAPDWSGFR